MNQLVNPEHCAGGGGYLIRLHYDEDVVHPNSQHQERNDLDHNEDKTPHSFSHARALPSRMESFR
ncbi:hypothetical protein EYF80_063945 [Liparis tanakae]|uniref:Uncharacterized protein n=1 Tax=Liparis tanakae TaxID=230148 RepID=A0A4Z2EBH9_9TELE|nr:hypothetical protein EYF80_063945 [Liparis tanakae]